MKVATVRLPASIMSLTIEQQPEPQVTAGKVKVRWHAFSLNFHDYAVVTGMMPISQTRIPASDGAGEIVEVGPGVTGWEPGDKVMSLFFPKWQDGPATAEGMSCISGDSVDGFAVEFSVVDPDSLTRIPRGYTYAEAATLPCAALTAWRALVEIGQIKPGDRVLVEGTGGVSVFALQFAKAHGAVVYATSSSDEKLQRLKDLGADFLVNYRTDSSWGETVQALSKGGVDHVIDVGGPTTLEHSILAARVDANVVLVGLLGGMETRINLACWMIRQQRIRPVAVGSRKMQQDMVRDIEAFNIKPVIDSSFPMDQLAEAFRYQVSGRHLGKIVIEIAGA
jgi:NADPH:quinone reductase-like Zn-dependent oxidoreductase